MRTLITLLAASTLVGGCACAEADIAGLPTGEGATARVASGDDAATEQSVTDHRIPGGWWVDPKAEGVCTSPLAMGVAIACSLMLNVCTDEADATNRILPQVYSCTDESPTWRDVCATRPPAEWPFYAIEPEDCSAISAIGP